MPRLTANFINTKVEMPEPGKTLFYRDSELTGFGLKVTSTKMTYFAEARVNGCSRRVMLGNAKLSPPEEARKLALAILGKMAAGHDPAKEKQRQRRVSLTLGEAFDEYMAAKTLRPNTVASFNRVINQNLGDWLGKPVTSITRSMVMDRYAQLGSGSKKGTSGKANANLTMQVLRSVLNYASYKYAEQGEPLIADNPVRILRQTKAWHRIPQRQGIIPDHKLRDWVLSVLSLRNPAARDYHLVLLFTGMRRNEAAQLEWRDVDLEAKTLTVRAENNKSAREARLPLSDFLYELFVRRYAENKGSNFVFAGWKGKGRYYGCHQTLRKMREQSGCDFILHDIRRTFLTMAERLDIPHYALKKLANHTIYGDVTGSYLVIDVERLREPMQKITDRFLELIGDQVLTKLTKSERFRAVRTQKFH